MIKDGPEPVPTKPAAASFRECGKMPFLNNVTLHRSADFILGVDNPSKKIDNFIIGGSFD